MAVSVDKIVEFASALERTDFVGSGSRRRLRVGSNVYAVFSEDEVVLAAPARYLARIIPNPERATMADQDAGGRYTDQKVVLVLQRAAERENRCASTRRTTLVVAVLLTSCG